MGQEIIKPHGEPVVPTEETEMMSYARRVAGFFNSEPAVLEVYLFGSVARIGEGNDVDFIMITEKERAEGWLRARRRNITDEDMVHDTGASSGYYLATEALGIPSWKARDYRTIPGTFGSRYGIDIMLFPIDWRERQDELERKGNIKKGLIGEAIRDAIKL